MSGTLQYLPDWANMVSLRSLASFTYLSQVAFLGGDAKTTGCQLKGVVPKREVLYVGGQYANVTVSFGSPFWFLHSDQS